MSPRKFSVSRRIALGAIGAALINPRAALAGPLCHISGHAFGTTWRLTATAEDDLDRLAGAISALFADIDLTFSPWRADSLISRFNTGAAGPFACHGLSRKNRDLHVQTADLHYGPHNNEQQDGCPEHGHQHHTLLREISSVIFARGCHITCHCP